MNVENNECYIPHDCWGNIQKKAVGTAPLDRIIILGGGIKEHFCYKD